MDLKSYSLKDLILTAMKSEIDSTEIYSKLADRVKNAMLKSRLEFLALEEKKHENYFRDLWGKEFPNEQIKIPIRSIVPILEIEIQNDDIPISQLLIQAMKAEKNASEFYRELAELFDDIDVKNALTYIASMEIGHYKLIETEKEIAQQFEAFDYEWPMMHIGP